LLAHLPGDALVVVAGDHGEGLGEGGEEAHGLLLGDATLRVPLIVAGPGVAPAVVARPVSLVDVVPTLIARLGLPPDPSLDGADLFAPAARPGVFAETLYGAHHYGWAPLSALIGAEGRLVRGARDEEQGAVDEGMRSALGALSRAAPRWEAAPATLDLAAVEQLQALGYLGAATPAPGEGPAVDPRDGIRDLARIAALGGLTVAGQERALRVLLAEQPGFRDARFRLGLLLARTGRVEQGLSEIADLHRRAPDSTAATAAGDLSMQMGRMGDALSWYREALALDPRAAGARAGEVEALVGLGQLDEAEAQAQILLADAPDDARVLIARAWLGLAAGEPAARWVGPIDDLAGRRPWERGLLPLAARVHAEAGEADRAIELYREALRWQPWDLAARLALLALYREHGLRVDALKTLRPLLNLQPDEPRWRALEAELLAEMDARGRPSGG
jgi:tetratricopeptide (TPR) repeat protein